MPTIIIDIETVPLGKPKRAIWEPREDSFNYGAAKKEETKKANFDAAYSAWDSGEECGLSALMGQVAIIGIQKDENLIGLSLNYGEEKIAIGSFWDFAKEAFKMNGLTIIGFGNQSFDIPFLIRRSLILGIKIPDFIARDINKRFPDIIKDIRTVWAAGERQPKGKLEEVYWACFGERMPIVKTPTGRTVSGATFAECWKEDKAACMEYNKADLEATRRLAVHFGMMP